MSPTAHSRTLFKAPHVSVVDGPLGKVWIESDGKLITRVSFEKLNGRRADPPAVLNKACKELDLYFLGKKKKFSVPLQHQGSRFQKLVWDQIRAIGHGKSATYKQIGEQIGGKGIARTVGKACASNPILIFVPCHRVLASNGLLTGYVGGLWRKRWMLEHEGVLERDLFSDPVFS